MVKDCDSMRGKSPSASLRVEFYETSILVF